MIDIAGICIILHNMCIIGKDKFDIEWIKEIKKIIKNEMKNK